MTYQIYITKGKEENVNTFRARKVTFHQAKTYIHQKNQRDDLKQQHSTLVNIPDIFQLIPEAASWVKIPKPTQEQCKNHHNKQNSFYSPYSM